MIASPETLVTTSPTHIFSTVLLSARPRVDILVEIIWRSYYFKLLWVLKETKERRKEGTEKLILTVVEWNF